MRFFTCFVTCFLTYCCGYFSFLLKLFLTLIIYSFSSSFLFSLFFFFFFFVDEKKPLVQIGSQLVLPSNWQFELSLPSACQSVISQSVFEQGSSASLHSLPNIHVVGKTVTLVHNNNNKNSKIRSNKLL